MTTTGPNPTGAQRRDTNRPVGSTDDDRIAVYHDENRGLGWLVFAGTVLGFAGLLRIVDSIWAFGYHGALPDNLKDGVLGSDLRTYAWVWLGVGIVMLVSSVFLLARSQIARWVGFVAAVVGGVSAMTWMPYYPIWSLTYIGVAVLVFFALARYGGPETA